MGEWDDELDGEWEAPMKDNPEFAGQWIRKKIVNPEYKGHWVRRKIPNPEFVDDNKMWKFENWGFVGIDVWQVKARVIFDNIIITDDKVRPISFWKSGGHCTRWKKRERSGRRRSEGKRSERAYPWRRTTTRRRM